MIPHKQRPSRSGFMYCARCGLVYLGNPASRRAIQKGCPPPPPPAPVH